MLSRMTATEFDEWQAYATLEPFGQEREDLRTALICTVLSNLVRPFYADPKPEPALLSDFLLFGEQESDEQPAEVTDDMMAALSMIFGAPPDAVAE